MKKIFSRCISTVLLCGVAFSVEAQSPNVPTGATTPPPSSSFTIAVPNPFVSGTGNLNFVRTYVPQIPVTDEASVVFSLTPTTTNYTAALKTVYLNGWGKPIESIVRGTPLISGVAVKDVVTAADLRPFMISQGYLPYAIAASSRFQLTPFTDQQSYYSTHYSSEGNWAFSQTINDMEVGTTGITPTSTSLMPGMSFVGGGRGTTTTTTRDDGTNHIEIYGIQNGALVDMGQYNAGLLTVKTVVGQHSSSTMGFYDKTGRIICKKEYAGTTGGAASWLTTYYVYDDMGRLTYTLTPKAVAALSGDVFSTLNTLSFGYTYNQYGQGVSTQKPGKTGSDVVVYDNKQRPVLLQSPLLHTTGKYLFKIYDTRDRVVMSGIYTDASLPATLQSAINSASYTTGTLMDYIANGFTGTYPASIPSCELDQVFYYDNYPAFCPAFSNTFSADYLTGVNMIVPTPYMVTQGMLTASKVRIKDNVVGSEWWTSNVYYYDQKSHLIQTGTLNPWNTATWDITTMQYNFAGQMVEQVRKYNDIAANPSIKVATVYDYDIYHNGRLVSVRQQINGAELRNIATYQYDDLGRISQKMLGGVEEQDYTYNIRGQLAGINSDYATGTPPPSDNKTFGCMLDYDYGFSSPRYDGQLSGIIWRGAGTAAKPNAYGYTYDPLNRLLSADYREKETGGSGGTISYWDNGTTDYSLSNMSYDENGNIMSMSQMGMPLSATYPVPLDELSYSYQAGTNKLVNVTDAVSSAGDGVGDFVDGNASATTALNDYNYDADGNLSQDLNKGVSSTVYNELDKPSLVTFQNGSTIAYVYDATGALVRRTVTDATATSGGTQVYRYWGPFVYKNDVLQYILHQEGRTRYIADSTAFKYDFFVKDNLGNVRTVVAADYAGNVNYFASHEVAAGSLETSIFSNIDNVRDDAVETNDATNLMAARLNGLDPQRQIGTAILLNVMAGDKFNVSAESYWSDSTPSQSTKVPNILQTIISTLTNGGSYGTMGEAAANKIINGTFNSANFSEYQKMLNGIADPNIPQAFINYLAFDNKMNLIPEESGAIQIGSVPDVWQSITTSTPITVARNGYLAIYMSNAQLQDIYMDNMTIAVYKGRLLQEQDYYPFGLPINEGEVTGAGAISNKFKFEGNEQYDDLGLDLQNFNARQYDYQIGRFTSVDPMADQQGQEVLSPYHFCNNNPANATDPGGNVYVNAYIYNHYADGSTDVDALYTGLEDPDEDGSLLPEAFALREGVSGGADGGGGGGGAVDQSMVVYSNGQVGAGTSDGTTVDACDGGGDGNSTQTATNNVASNMTFFTFAAYQNGNYAFTATSLPWLSPLANDATIADYAAAMPEWDLTTQVGTPAVNSLSPQSGFYTGSDVTTQSSYTYTSITSYNGEVASITSGLQIPGVAGLGGGITLNGGLIGEVMINNTTVNLSMSVNGLGYGVDHKYANGVSGGMWTTTGWGMPGAAVLGAAVAVYAPYAISSVGAWIEGAPWNFGIQ